MPRPSRQEPWRRFANPRAYLLRELLGKPATVERKSRRNNPFWKRVPKKKEKGKRKKKRKKNLLQTDRRKKKKKKRKPASAPSTRLLVVRVSVSPAAARGRVHRWRAKGPVRERGADGGARGARGARGRSEEPGTRRGCRGASGWDSSRPPFYIEPL